VVEINAAAELGAAVAVMELLSEPVAFSVMNAIVIMMGIADDYRPLMEK